LAPVLERVALHQNRFRTPGVLPDARGVLLGQKGLLLFPSLDRLVAFLRAHGETEGLDELLPSMTIRWVSTSLGTRELTLSFQAESSYRMDRVAANARLAGGLVFTGTSRHFVHYRDAASPLGYDVSRLREEKADLLLYHPSFQQGYAFERELAVAELVLKLTPFRVPPRDAPTSRRLFVTAEVGVGGALVGYLFRWEVAAHASLVEWPSESAFEDRPTRLYLFSVEDCPERIVSLMRALPGVTVYVPVGARVAVEMEHRHPIALDACASLFPEGSLHLFSGAGPVRVVSPEPRLAPVSSLVRTPPSAEGGVPTVRGDGAGTPETFTLPLRLAPTATAPRMVVATRVSREERPWLARMLYALPSAALRTLRVALAEDAVYLLDSRGIEGVPVGSFYQEVAERIYVPVGLTLVPAVAPGVLESLLADRGTGHAFFDPGGALPRLIADDAFGEVSRRALREVGLVPVSADAPEVDEPELSLLRYGEARRFPLWGVPAKDAKAGGPEDGA